MSKSSYTTAAGFALGLLGLSIQTLAGGTPVATISGATVSGSASIPPPSVSSLVIPSSTDAGTSAVVVSSTEANVATSIPSATATNVTLPSTLASISISMAPGSTVTFVGPSGSFTATRSSGGGFTVTSSANSSFSLGGSGAGVGGGLGGSGTGTDGDGGFRSETP